MSSPERLPLFFYGFCISGEADLEIDMKPCKFSKGDIVRIRMGQTLLVKSVSEDFNSVLFFFDRRVISGFVSGLKVPLGNTNPIFKTSEELYGSMLLYLNFVKSRLDLCKTEKTAYLRAACEFLMKAMLCEVLNEVSKSCVAQEKGSRTQEIFLKFSSMVKENFKKTRNVKYYADQLCITPKYLCKIVSECVGSSPSQFIDSLVMTEAKQMLRTSNLSIQQISEALNFPNQSFFGRFFKTHAGVSPGAYRNEKC
jgi:AraC-like DNA-binding protein